MSCNVFCSSIDFFCDFFIGLFEGPFFFGFAYTYYQISTHQTGIMLGLFKSLAIKYTPKNIQITTMPSE